MLLMYSHNKIHRTSLDNPEAVEFSKNNRVSSDGFRRYCWSLFLRKKREQRIIPQNSISSMTQGIIRQFGKLDISNENIFMQDGAAPHWFTNVRNWLNENLPGRWILRES